MALTVLAVVRLRPAASQPMPLQVSSVSAAVVQPVGGAGHCPQANYSFVGTIKTNGGGGALTYRWLQPDGQTSPPQTISMEAGAKQVTVTLLFKLAGNGSLQGVAALHVTSPIDAASPPVSVTYTCP